jgi:hypothetical protein
MFALICTFFAFITALYGPLRGLDHLFDQFPNISLYFYTVVFLYRIIIGVPIPFPALGSLTFTSFRKKSENDHLL